MAKKKQRKYKDILDKKTTFTNEELFAALLNGLSKERRRTYHEIISFYKKVEKEIGYVPAPKKVAEADYNDIKDIVFCVKTIQEKRSYTTMFKHLANLEDDGLIFSIDLQGNNKAFFPRSLIEVISNLYFTDKGHLATKVQKEGLSGEDIVEKLR